MKTFACAVLAALTAHSALSAATNRFHRAYSEEELERRLELRQLGGGYLRRPGSAKGVFVILNAQTKVPAADLQSAAEGLGYPNAFAFETQIMEISGVTPRNVTEKIAAAGGTVGVALVEDDFLPMLLTAPESGWSVVNVTKIGERCPDAVTFASRVRKEVMRAFAFTTGCAYMTMADPLMRDVRKPSDLDGLPSEKFGLEILNKVRDSAPFYGLKPWLIASYREACEQGWAPPPTNKYQRAAWKRVHAIPATPMKIEFDPKKGK